MKTSKIVVAIAAIIAGSQLCALAGDLVAPKAVAVDSKGYIYVADVVVDHRVLRKFNPDGTFLADLKTVSSGLNCLAIDKEDNLYFDTNEIGHPQITKATKGGIWFIRELQVRYLDSGRSGSGCYRS